jgi:hypothetical protein
VFRLPAFFMMVTAFAREFAAPFIRDLFAGFSVPEFTFEQTGFRESTLMVSQRVPWQPIFKTPEGLSLPLAEAFLLSGEQIRTSLHELHVGAGTFNCFCLFSRRPFE